MNRHTGIRFKITGAVMLLLVGCLLCGLHEVQARPRHLFKIATMAPEGSVWMETFHDFADEVLQKSGGTIGFKVYAGGVMGDDQAMYRKMRVGQLHGGGFTMTGIATTVPDFRIMALPFFFRSYGEVDAVKEGLLPLFKTKFAAKKLELIAMTEVGFVYAMGTAPITSIADLKKGKCWSPAGDPLTATFLSAMGIMPIQLSIPDVLSSLQTGLVDTVFNSLYGSIVLQWFTKAKVVTDVPYGYAYGVFLLDRRAVAKLDPKELDLIHTTADKYFSALLQKTRQSNLDSRKTLMEHGVRFIPSPKEVLGELYGYRDQTITQLKDKAFSGEIYKRAAALLSAHRNSAARGKRQP